MAGKVSTRDIRLLSGVCQSVAFSDRGGGLNGALLLIELAQVVASGLLGRLGELSEASDGTRARLTESLKDWQVDIERLEA